MKQIDSLTNQWVVPCNALKAPQPFMGPHHLYLCSSHRIRIPAGWWACFRGILSQELLNMGWCLGCSCYQKIWGKQIISEWTPAHHRWRNSRFGDETSSSKKCSMYFRLLCHGLPGFRMFFSLTLSHSSSGENIRIPKLLSDKEPTWQYRRHSFDPWVGKIPWSRKRMLLLLLSHFSRVQLCLTP